MSGYFEIRTTDAGVHLVARGDNNEDVVLSQVYPEKRSAREAIEFLGHMFTDHVANFDRAHVTFALDDEAMGAKVTIPINYVDQRAHGEVSE